MIDARLRAAKDRVVDPVVARLPRVLTPGAVTAGAALAGVGAGCLAATRSAGASARVVFTGMAALVVLTVAQRVAWAIRNLA